MIFSSKKKKEDKAAADEEEEEFEEVTHDWTGLASLNQAKRELCQHWQIIFHHRHSKPSPFKTLCEFIGSHLHAQKKTIRVISN